MNLLGTNESSLQKFAVHIYSAVALIFSVACELWISDNRVGIGAAIIFTISIVTITGVFYFLGQIRQKKALILLLPIIFLFGSFAFYADNVSQWALYPCACILAIIYLIIATVHIREPIKFHLFSIPIVKKFFLPVIKKLNGLSQALVPSFGRTNNLERTKLIITGVLISLPLLLIFTLLLISADSSFKEVLFDLKDVLSISTTDFWLHFFKIIVFSILISSFLFVITRPDHEVVLKQHTVEKFNGTIVGTFLSMISLLFMSFIIVQFTHMFGSYEYVRVNEIIFSEYAHQGFIQLLIVTGVALIIFFVTYRAFIFHGMSRLLRGVHVLFLVQVAVIALSAVNRINLYEEAYGYTVKRVLVEWLGWTLVVMILCMAIAVVLRQSFRNILYIQAGVFIGALCVLPVLRIEYRAAYHNMSRFVEGRSAQLDLAYVDNLGDAAFPALGLLAQAGVPEKISFIQVQHIKNALEEYVTSTKKLAWVEKTAHDRLSENAAMQLERAFKDKFEAIEKRKQTFLDMLNKIKEKEIKTTCGGMNVRIDYAAGMLNGTPCARKGTNFPEPYRSFIYAIPNNYRPVQGKTMMSSFLQSIGYKPGTKEIETVFIPLREIELPNFPLTTEGDSLSIDNNINISLLEYLNKYTLTTDGKMYIFDISTYRYREYDVKAVPDTKEVNQYRIEFVLLNEQ